MRTAAVLVLALLVGGGSAAASTRFRLTTSTFRANARMPKSTSYNAGGCTGSNRSPELQWRAAPRGTRSFALIVHDADAPLAGGWYHWVVYDLPPKQRSLEGGESIPQAHLGITSWNRRGYGGPCPPPGSTHHYRFTLYALNVRAISGTTPTGPELLARMRRHVLARATLMGTYRQ